MYLKVESRRIVGKILRNPNARVIALWHLSHKNILKEKLTLTSIIYLH